MPANFLNGAVVEISEGILELFPALRGLRKIIRGSVKAGESLLNALTKSVPEYINNDSLPPFISPYKFRVKSREDAEKIRKTINQFCAPHIQNLWLDTQDKLITDGTNIRHHLVHTIQLDIQGISNELSYYLGQSLLVEMNINDIQFPEFEFAGIDAKIKDQQELYRKKETKNICCSDQTYEVEATEFSKRDVYDIDLRETAELIKQSY